MEQPHLCTDAKVLEPQIYIKLDCIMRTVPVAQARDWHAPFVTTTDGNQYSFMQGVVKVLRVKASSPASSFAAEAHDECMYVHWPR